MCRCEYDILKLTWVDWYGTMVSTGQVSSTIVMSMSTRSPWMNVSRSKMFLRWCRKLVVDVVTDRRQIRYCSCNYRNDRILINIESKLISICVDDNDDCRPIRYAPKVLFSLESHKYSTKDSRRRAKKSPLFPSWRSVRESRCFRCGLLTINSPLTSERCKTRCSASQSS